MQALHHPRSNPAGIFVEVDATSPEPMETLRTRLDQEEFRPKAVELGPCKGHKPELRDPSEHAASFDTAPCKSESLSYFDSVRVSSVQFYVAFLVLSHKMLNRHNFEIAKA